MGYDNIKLHSLLIRKKKEREKSDTAQTVFILKKREYRFNRSSGLTSEVHVIEY